MKRLIYGLLLCFIMGLTQVAWADTTNSGATTNSQTNTSGSNTTISGGYSQESTTTYESGSSSNTTSTTNNTTNAYSGDTRVTSSASAPGIRKIFTLYLATNSGKTVSYVYLNTRDIDDDFFTSSRLAL